MDDPYLALEVGFEPTTKRLTISYSTAELLQIKVRVIILDIFSVTQVFGVSRSIRVKENIL